MNIRSRCDGWIGLAMVIAGAFALGVVGTSAQQGGPGPATKGELRVAVQIYNPILVSRNVQGDLSGVGVDLANAYAKKLGATVKFVSYENSGGLTKASPKTSGIWPSPHATSAAPRSLPSASRSSRLTTVTSSNQDPR